MDEVLVFLFLNQDVDAFWAASFVILSSRLLQTGSRMNFDLLHCSCEELDWRAINVAMETQIALDCV